MPDHKSKLTPEQIARMSAAVAQTFAGVFGAGSAMAKQLAATGAAMGKLRTTIAADTTQLDAAIASLKSQVNAQLADIEAKNTKLKDKYQTIADLDAVSIAFESADLEYKDAYSLGDEATVRKAHKRMLDELMRATEHDLIYGKRKLPDWLDPDATQEAPQEVVITMDDFLDDIDTGTARKSFKTDYSLKGGRIVGKPKGKVAPAPPDDYYAIPGGGATYEAKGHLKALGGYWDADAYCWYVPKAARTEATRALNEATMAKAMHSSNPEAAAEMLRRNVPLKGETGFNLPVSQVVCWECGGLLHEETMPPLQNWPNRPAHFRQQGRFQLREGAVVEHAYCGCVGRGDKPRSADRPSFR